METISAIYEDFLEAEDKEGKHDLGAYYTPRNLAEFVVNLAIQNGEDVGSWKFLDPSAVNRFIHKRTFEDIFNLRYRL